MATRKILRARDIERLENTSIAVLSAAAPIVGGAGVAETNTCPSDTCPSDTCPTYETCDCPWFECIGPTSCCHELQKLLEDYVNTYGCAPTAHIVHAANAR